MANIRTVTLSWNPVSGSLRAITGLAPYLKREEPVALVVKVPAANALILDLKLTLKPDGEFDGTPLLQLTGWTWDADALTWSRDTTISSAEIDTLLAVNDDTADDVKTAPCSLDIVALGAADAVLAESDTLDLTLKNNVGNTGDATPGSSVDPSANYVAHTEYAFKRLVTGYTGGGATNLDGIVTVGKSFGLVQFIHATVGLRSYQLVAGTDAEDSPGIIRPDDYHASTNAFTWQQV